MGNDEERFKFSKLVELYCENWEVVKTVEARWKAEADELMKRLKARLAGYDDEWDIYLSHTYGTVRKKAWGKDSPISYDLGFDPGRIGKRKLWVSIHVTDKQMREKICEDLRDRIREVFGSDVTPRTSYVTSLEKDVPERDYEEAIMLAVQTCIDFAPHLEPYVAVD